MNTTNWKDVIKAPQTHEGWSVLHQVYQINWAAWREISPQDQENILIEAEQFFQEHKASSEGETALFSVLGSKGDLLVLHFRKTFDELNAAELAFAQTHFSSFLQPMESYVSLVELGTYEMTVKLAEELSAKGLSPDSEDWKALWQEKMKGQYEKMKGRIFPEVPKRRYLCFYPMDKKRGESVNWYQVPMEERQRMMREHGMIGRKYAGKVTQIITGSIGLDDWEWGVYLFADIPNVFKDLIYEMRFDEASAAYADFGPFWTALQFSASELKTLMKGEAPCLNA